MERAIVDDVALESAIRVVIANVFGGARAAHIVADVVAQPTVQRRLTSVS